MAAQSTSEPQTTVKLSPAQRIERLVIAVAFIGLVLTGIPQRFASESWANILIVIGGGIESLRILHRFFAILLLAEAVFHVLAVIYRWFVVGQRPVMLPGIGDLRELVGRFFANIGLRRDSTENPSYRFVFKFEYLILVIGVLVLGITGLILWSPIAATTALPGEVVPVARSVHSDHAMLTVILIVLLRIGVLLLWHPSRAAIFADQPVKPVPAERISARRRIYLPIAVVVALAATGALYLFLSSEQTAINTVPRRQAVIYAPETIPESGDPHIGAVLWETLRCAFCHGESAGGGSHGEPALRPPELPYAAFYEQVRIGRGEMPAFNESELPDGYLVHLWAWLTQPDE